MHFKQFHFFKRNLQKGPKCYEKMHGLGIIQKVQQYLKLVRIFWRNCLEFFSSQVNGGMHCFTRELKRPHQRQGAFLRHLKCPNQNRYEVQSCSTKKVGSSNWCRFFDPMIFRPLSPPSGGFIQKNPHESKFHLTRVI